MSEVVTVLLSKLILGLLSKLIRAVPELTTGLYQLFTHMTVTMGVALPFLTTVASPPSSSFRRECSFCTLVRPILATIALVSCTERLPCFDSINSSR